MEIEIFNIKRMEMIIDTTADITEALSTLNINIKRLEDLVFIRDIDVLASGRVKITLESMKKEV